MRNRLVFLAVPAIIILILLVFLSEHKQQTNINTRPTNVNKAQGAAGFTQQVYEAYIRNWGEGEKQFISNNSKLFSENISYMFCNKLQNKPDSITTLGTSVLNDNKTVLIYLTAKYHGKAEVSNLPIYVQASGGNWKIDSVKCDLI